MLFLLDSGGGGGEMTSGPGPRVKWNGMKGEMKIMWTLWRPKCRQPTAGMRVRMERSQSLSEVGTDCWTVGTLAGIELPGGVPQCYPHIAGGQFCWMWRAAEEMGNRVVGGAAIGAGGVIDTAYGVALGLEPWTVARSLLSSHFQREFLYLI